MGWFKDEKKTQEINDVPSLPSLPSLPELPSLQRNPNKRVFEEPLPQLPSFPSNAIGNKFSQNAIKEALSGDEEVVDGYANDFDEQTMQLPSLKPMKPIAKEIKSKPRKIEEEHQFEYVKKAEPVFIRIDKFEESLEIFTKTKKQIMEMEKMLKDIKTIKDEEEKELESWENEIQSIKEQIEKIDDEIFSKIE